MAVLKQSLFNESPKVGGRNTLRTPYFEKYGGHVPLSTLWSTSVTTSHQGGCGVSYRVGTTIRWHNDTWTQSYRNSNSEWHQSVHGDNTRRRPHSRVPAGRPADQPVFVQRTLSGFMSQ